MTYFIEVPEQSLEGFFKFNERFEQELIKVRESLGKTRGNENVIEQVGRTIGKYPLHSET